MSTPKSQPQIDFVRSLQRRLHLPDDVLNQHCQRIYGAQFDQLDRPQTTQLLTAMASWGQLPAELMRAKGQLDLMGFGEV